MERLWTKSFTLMTIGNLFLFNAFYMLYPTMPLFITQMGGNESQVGLAMGAFMLAAVIFRPLVGGLLDRFGRRPFLIWGLILFIVAMYMYNWVGGIVVLMGLRILHGMSWAVSTTATMTAITDMIPAARRGEGMGWFSTSMTLAMAIGPLFGIWVTENQSYSALFLIAVFLSAVALILMLGAKMPFRPQTGVRKIELFEKSVLPIAASVFFLFIAYGGITTFVPLFAKSIQVNSGAFFLAFAASLALSRPISGKLSDRYGEIFVIVPALVITIGALIVLSLSTGLIGVLASAVLYGIGFGSAQPALQAATIRLARPDRIGVANASISTANDLGIGLGAIMLGWVSQSMSYQALFTVSAVSVAFSLILFTFFVKRLLKNKEPHPLNTDPLSSKQVDAVSQ
ncbi:Predicted arabinose efflux permease, MFS family [Paenibacillus algorifonticola]|uniref:Predicted arabinose efflux permease, MFS family n=1 Tax=Paenibacillus algorifonticola TaxID=684063 RepID=A0A1I1YV84_9BACL|nr:MFS transporter [Paenibacillus algorifonticola]SFE23371.1 Predicted arabinose efflux permease, MFS family [Paenibacillus algorifonticola]